MNKPVSFVVGIIFFIIIILFSMNFTSIINFLGIEGVTINNNGEDNSKSNYKIVDTNQLNCYSNTVEIECGGSFVGQDAEYEGNEPEYTDNENGIITDEVTGLMWIKEPIQRITYDEAVKAVSTYTIGGYTDWRLPTIKELYSLMDFTGIDPGLESTPGNSTPFINTNYFTFYYGDISKGDRLIDAQYVTSTLYESTVMNNQGCFFGVNFADGRIKCYPIMTDKKYYAYFVRGESYGGNNFKAVGDLVIDYNTELVWMRNDSGKGLTWSEALNYCESLETPDYSDWRLPNAKELHSIVDYTRSPDITSSASISGEFRSTEIQNEAGEKDYPFYWTSTTHNAIGNNAESAVYISFGRALGFMSEFGGWIDVHGAGAQRSDFKTGDPSEYPTGFGPQGDARRIKNYARCVRDLD